MSSLLTIEEWHAVRLSLQVATCASLLGLPLAVAIGYRLARSPGRAKWLVEVIVNLPLVLPPVVVGYLLLIIFSPRGPLGSLLWAWFGIKIVFTWWGAVLASVVVSFPLMVRAIRLAFQGIDPRLEMAARSLGAGPLRSFWTVSLPLARRGLIGGCVLGFARSLGEFCDDPGCREYRRPDCAPSLWPSIPSRTNPAAQGGRGTWSAWRFCSPAGRLPSASGSSGGKRPMPLLEVQCRHRFPSGFQLQVAFALDRRFTTLFGPSGAGKTTVLSIVAGFVRPQEGRRAAGRPHAPGHGPRHVRPGPPSLRGRGVSRRPLVSPPDGRRQSPLRPAPSQNPEACRPVRSRGRSAGDGRIAAPAPPKASRAARNNAWPWAGRC